MSERTALCTRVIINHYLLCVMLRAALDIFMWIKWVSMIIIIVLTSCQRLLLHERHCLHLRGGWRPSCLHDPMLFDSHHIASWNVILKFIFKLYVTLITFANNNNNNINNIHLLVQAQRRLYDYPEFHYSTPHDSLHFHFAKYL